MYFRNDFFVPSFEYGFRCAFIIRGESIYTLTACAPICCVV